jgi:hypothetical protein
MEGKNFRFQEVSFLVASKPSRNMKQEMGEPVTCLVTAASGNLRVHSWKIGNEAQLRRSLRKILSHLECELHLPQ